MKILVLNGPNLNLLGERDTGMYGTKTLEQVNDEMAELAKDLGVEISFCQSNHEGDLIDRIHSERATCRGIIINPGALTHYGYSLHDALEAVGIPAVEVHISNIFEREEWRRHSVITPVAWRVIAGRGTDGYLEALRDLVANIRGES